MSMQGSHEQNGSTALSMGLSAASLNTSQFYQHTGGARHMTDDVYSTGRLHDMHAATGYVPYSKPQKSNSPVSSLSPPQSSITSELPPQMSLEYPCDGDSHRWDYSLCSQDAYFHKQFTDEACYVESPQSLPGYSSGMQCAEAPSLDGSTSFSSAKSMKLSLEELESALLGPDGDGVESVEFAGDNDSFWTGLLDGVAPPTGLPTTRDGMQVRDISVAHQRGIRQQVGSSSYRPANVQCSQHPLEALILNQGSRAKTLLVMCAYAIAENKMDMADAVMEELRKEVSVLGDPMKRLAAYMYEGLVAKLQCSGFALYRVLKCMEAPAADVLSAMQKLYEICPYFKFAYMAANGAIAEAFKNEAKVHIFDFQIGQGTQWISLMQGLANRPGGPPSIRITTVEDTTAQGSPIGGMQLVRNRLGKLAVSLNVPFEFTSIPCRLPDLEAHMIERRQGEALAVNFTFQLHHMPDESVCISNPRDRLLRMMRSLNPKVLTLVEQEANTNTTPFFPRFMEVLDCYTSIFESIDVALPRESKDRVNVEEQCLARDIVNVIACEGADRVERHELMGKWRARMSMAGFRPHPLSAYVNDTIKMLLKSYSESYKLKEEGGALFLGWLNRSLVVASAWH